MHINVVAEKNHPPTEEINNTPPLRTSYTNLSHSLDNSSTLLSGQRKFLLCVGCGSFSKNPMQKYTKFPNFAGLIFRPHFTDPFNIFCNATQFYDVISSYADKFSPLLRLKLSTSMVGIIFCVHSSKQPQTCRKLSILPACCKLVIFIKL